FLRARALASVVRRHAVRDRRGPLRVGGGQDAPAARALPDPGDPLFAEASGGGQGDDAGEPDRPGADDRGPARPRRRRAILRAGPVRPASTRARVDCQLPGDRHADAGRGRRPRPGGAVAGATRRPVPRRAGRRRAPGAGRRGEGRQGDRRLPAGRRPGPLGALSGRAGAGRTGGGLVKLRRPLVAVWALALWLAVAGNLPLWERVGGLAGTPSQRLGLFAGLGLLVAGATAALLSLMAWPRVFRPAATVLALVSALNTHFMHQYGAVIDAGMLANVVQTDVREVRDLLSWSLPVTVLLVAGPPLWWIWRRPLASRGWLPQTGRNAFGALAALGLVVVAVLLSYQDLASLMRNEKSLRYMINPLNAVYAATRLAADQLPRQVRALQPVGEDARLGASY